MRALLSTGAAAAAAPHGVTPLHGAADGGSAEAAALRLETRRNAEDAPTATRRSTLQLPNSSG